MRIAAERLLNLQGETVHAAPHIGPPHGKPHTYTRREGDHRRSSASSTARNVAALTPEPTRMRVPCRNSISIPSSGGAADGGGSLRSGVTTTGTIDGSADAADVSLYRLRHVKTMLVFTPYCWATAETEAPGADAAATISRFSASGQDLCCRLTRSLFGPGV